MSVALVANQPRIWDYYLAGPYTQNATLTNNFLAALDEFLTPGYTPISFANTTPRQVFTFAQAGAGVVQTRAYHRGILALQTSTTVVAAINGMGGIDI